MSTGNYMQVPTQLDSAEWSSGVVTNYDVSAQTLFVNCLNPKHVNIRADTACTVRFNSTSNPAITISANTAFDLDLDIHHMYLTTTGATAVKIILTQ